MSTPAPPTAQRDDVSNDVKRAQRASRQMKAGVNVPEVREKVPPVQDAKLAHPKNATVMAKSAHRMQQDVGNRATRKSVTKDAKADHAGASRKPTLHGSAAHKGTHGAHPHGTAHSGASQKDEEADQSAGPPDPASLMTDTQAQGALLAEWRAGDGDAFVAESVDVRFDAATVIDLRIPEPVESAKKKTPAGDPQAAAREVTAGYAQFVVDAQREHETVQNDANRIIRAIDSAGDAALSQADAAMMGPLMSELSAIDASRHKLDEDGKAALMTIDQQAATARRQISGAVILAGRKVDEAVAAAAGQLPAIKTDIIGRFSKLYDENSKTIADSGKAASDTLKSQPKKDETANKIDHSDNPEIEAKVEAKRAAIPGLLDGMAQTRQGTADQYSAAVKARLNQYPVIDKKYGLEQEIDGFMASIKLSIDGGTAGGQTVESLKVRGHKAIDEASKKAYGSLYEQVKAAKDTAKHTKTSGDQLITQQRSAAFSRLTQTRRGTVANIRETRARSIQSLISAAKSGLPVYADSTKRLAETLKQTAQKGAQGLQETAHQSFARVKQNLADGRVTQVARLYEVETGAQKSVDDALVTLPMELQSADAEFENNLAEQMTSVSKNLTELIEGQTKGFNGLASGVTGAAKSYTEPMAKMFAKAVEDEKTKLNPTFEGESANVKKVTDDCTAADKKQVDDPLADLKGTLESIGTDIDTKCNTWGNAAKSALFDGLTTDEDGLMAALRSHTRAQEASIEAKYSRFTGGSNLRADIEKDHDRTIGGLNDNQYHACLRYLAGDAKGGAEFELASTVHWYGGEGQHAEDVMRSLSVAEQKEVGQSEVGKRVAGSLYGNDLNVFNALAVGNEARADAYRLKQKLAEAYMNQDTEAAVTAMRQYGGGPDESGKFKHLEEVQREFADIQGLNKDGHQATQDEAATALAKYATNPWREYQEDKTKDYTSLSKADAAMLTQMAMHGVDSKEGKAARILREGESGDKPNFEQLENAAVDPRLNPALTPGLSAQQRAQAKKDQDDLFLEYAKQAQAYGLGKVETPEQARQLAADRLKQQFDLDSEKGKVGADYVESIVKDPVPDAAAGMRYAQLGAGTDEDMIHRNLGRLSREDAKKMVETYNKRYKSDLYADLGVYGKGSFGELSGDDRLKAEVELMGVPQTDQEKAEVARYRQMQQRNETGAMGAAMNEGSGVDIALSASEKKLKEQIGGKIELDEFGRPMIKSDRFNDKGEYVGPNREEFAIETNAVQTVAENYSARIDRITSYFTTAIAIIGAVVATIVTGGAGAPLLAAAIAGGAGLLSMGVSYAMKGGRYGWEQAVTDLGLTAVQMLTAGVGQSLGAAAKGGAAAAEGIEAAEAVEGAAVKTTASAVASQAPSKLVSAVKVGAATGGITGLGNTALNEHTWDKGFWHGLGEVGYGGVKGVAGGAATALISHGINNISLGGSTIGDRVQGLDVTGKGFWGGASTMLQRGALHSGVNALAAMGGKATELGMDTATGRFKGSFGDAMSEVGQTGTQALVQGFGEGMGQAVHDPHRPTPAQVRTTQQQAASEVDHRIAPPKEAAIAGEHPNQAAAPPQEQAARPQMATGGVTEGTPRAPESGASTPRESTTPAEPGGTHEAQGPRPANVTPDTIGGDVDHLFDNIDNMRSGPMVEASAKDLEFRLGRGQTDYFGAEPRTGMTVQEFGMQSATPSEVDNTGRPIYGPHPDSETHLRLHSPDPTAPEGSPSREGWTINIEQGPRRMNGAREWFDTRFGQAPDGSLIDVRSYRRGPDGEWVNGGTGKPVTKADVVAALENWDANMRSSHIEMYPEPPARPMGGGPRGGTPEIPPPEPTEGGGTGERAAAGIKGTPFTGDGAAKYKLEAATEIHAQDAAKSLLEPGTSISKFAQPTEHPNVVTMKAANGEPLRVTIEMVDTLPPGRNGEIPVATYEEGANGQYVVKVSKGAPADAVERALAHELTEIHYAHGMKGEPPDVLGHGTPSIEITPENLSPHDRGRLAELEVLARKLKAPGLDEDMVESLSDEAMELMRHLGLHEIGPEAQAKIGLAKSFSGDTDDMIEGLLGREAQEGTPSNRKTMETPGRPARSAEEMARPIRQEELQAIAKKLGMTNDEVLDLISDHKDAMRQLRKEVLRELRQMKHGPLNPRFEGHIFDEMLKVNVEAVGSIRKSIVDANPDMIIGVKRGGELLSDIVTTGDAEMSKRVVPMEKGANPEERIEILRKLIMDGLSGNPAKTNFVLTDFYMGGFFAEKLFDLVNGIAETHPNFKFKAMWLREQYGFQTVNDGAIEWPNKKVKISPTVAGRVENEYHGVPVVVGDDMDMVFDPNASKPFKIFNRQGEIVKEFKPGMPDPQTGEPMTARQILTKLLNGELSIEPEPTPETPPAPPIPPPVALPPAPAALDSSAADPAALATNPAPLASAQNAGNTPKSIIVEYGAGMLENAIAMQQASPQSQVIAIDKEMPQDLPPQIDKLQTAGGKFAQASDLSPVADGTADTVVAHYPWKTGEEVVLTLKDFQAGKKPIMRTDDLPLEALKKLRDGGVLEIVTEMKPTANDLAAIGEKVRLSDPNGGEWAFVVDHIEESTASKATPNSKGMQVESDGVSPNRPVYRIVMMKTHVP